MTLWNPSGKDTALTRGDAGTQKSQRTYAKEMCEKCMILTVPPLGFCEANNFLSNLTWTFLMDTDTDWACDFLKNFFETDIDLMAGGHPKDTTRGRVGFGEKDHDSPVGVAGCSLKSFTWSMLRDMLVGGMGWWRWLKLLTCSMLRNILCRGWGRGW